MVVQLDDEPKMVGNHQKWWLLPSLIRFIRYRLLKGGATFHPSSRRARSNSTGPVGMTQGSYNDGRGSGWMVGVV